MMNELPEFNDIRSKLSRPSTIRLRLKSQADAAIILFMMEQPKKYRLQLAGFLARRGLKRQKQITKWFPEMKEPLRQLARNFQKLVMSVLSCLVVRKLGCVSSLRPMRLSFWP